MDYYVATETIQRAVDQFDFDADDRDLAKRTLVCNLIKELPRADDEDKRTAALKRALDFHKATTVSTDANVLEAAKRFLAFVQDGPANVGAGIDVDKVRDAILSFVPDDSRVNRESSDGTREYADDLARHIITALGEAS